MRLLLPLLEGMLDLVTLKFGRSGSHHITGMEDLMVFHPKNQS
jgi:hypothetical protein